MILTLFSAKDHANAEGTRLSALPACVCALKRWAAWMLADANRWLEGHAPAKMPLDTETSTPPTRR